MSPTSTSSGQTSPLSRDGLTKAIIHDIVGESPAPGTKLPSERQIALRYGISRTVVREVLRTLHERGLIDVQPSRGAFVREVHANDVAGPMGMFIRRYATPRDLVEARTMLECQSATLAAQRATTRDLVALQRVFEAFENAPSIVEQARADIGFHALIVRSSYNPLLEAMFASIGTFVFELMLRSLDDPVVSKEGSPYHENIVEAIRRREPRKAATAMRHHVTLATDLYGADLDKNLDAITQQRFSRLFGLDIDLQTVVAGALAEYVEGFGRLNERS